MAKAEEVVKESWGTWEELLLACAVNRHGTNSWDSVAMEIQNRNTSLRLFTPQNCKQKYHDLKHRFMAKDDKTVVVGEDKSETSDVIPWLEELRKLRVAELRREVQRHDVSIVSLQLKVKRLKEEREQSLREKEHGGDQKPDLETDLDGNRVEEKDNRGDEKQEKSMSENAAEAPVAGDESDRENQSFNESNSTDPKVENREKGVDEGEKKPEPVEPVPRGPDPVSGDSKPIAEGSYHGSSETIARESMAQPVRKSRGDNMATKENDSPELGESVAESKGVGEEGHKESSDVQSSASLSRKNRRKKASSGSSSGEERENDEISPAIKRISDKSQPLMSFLAIIRSHKYGSVFECRLESQETSIYRNLIRHHVDLELVQARLEEGRYNGCSRKFFRDLLLLFNNAIVFFYKNSSEWIAAVELRKIVSKELANRNRKLGRPKEEETAVPETTVPPPAQSKPESEPEPPPKLAKPKSSAPIVVACRKRSSISTKPSSAVVDKKAEPKPVSEADDEKQVSDRKRGAVSSSEEEKLTKKRTRERSALGARSSRARSKSRSKTTTTTHTNKNTGSIQTTTTPGPNSSSAGRRTSHDEEAKTERKNNDTVEAVAKKRSAASFLNRMKRNSNGTLLESLKNSVKSSENDKSGGSRETEVGQKRGGGVKGDGRKDHGGGGGRQSSAGKQSANQNSPVKRSVGRPPKRATAPPPLPPPAPTKRTRETVQTEVVASRQSRKRTRR